MKGYIGWIHRYPDYSVWIYNYGSIWYRTSLLAKNHNRHGPAHIAANYFIKEADNVLFFTNGIRVALKYENILRLEWITKYRTDF